MKISVVTAAFNRACTIDCTLSSVQKQTYRDVEHIIQDGGSTDGTLDVVRTQATGQTVIHSEPDNGIYDALNKGIANASGDVIGFMHSDDFYASPDVLKAVAGALQDPQVDGVYGDLDYVAKDDTDRVVRHWVSGECSARSLHQGWMPPHPTLYLRREVYEKYGVYDTSYQIAADYEAMLRYLKKGKVRLAYIPEVMVKMRMGGESNRSLARLFRKSREDLRAMRLHGVGGPMTLLRKNGSKVKQFFAAYTSSGASSPVTGTRPAMDVDPKVRVRDMV